MDGYNLTYNCHNCTFRWGQVPDKNCTFLVQAVPSCGVGEWWPTQCQELDGSRSELNTTDSFIWRFSLFGFLLTCLKTPWQDGTWMSRSPECWRRCCSPWATCRAFSEYWAEGEEVCSCFRDQSYSCHCFFSPCLCHLVCCVPGFGRRDSQIQP